MSEEKSGSLFNSDGSKETELGASPGKVITLPGKPVCTGIIPQPASITELLSIAVQNNQVEMLKTLSELYTRERDDERRMAFNRAMAQAQSEMLRVAPDATNPSTKSRYATYATLDKAIRPIYTKYGFGLSFNTVAGAVPEMVRVTCRVSHVDGWAENYEIDMPADGKGAKGGDVQTKTHATGSGLTYGRRYLLMSIFNLAIGIDDDGNAAGGQKSINEMQAEELRQLAINTGTPEAILSQAYGAVTIENIPANMYTAAKAMLKRKISAKETRL